MTLIFRNVIRNKIKAGFSNMEKLEEVLTEFNFDLTQRNEQVECLRHLMDAKNVFFLLPTGFGKSMIYTIFPVGTRGLKSRMCPPYPHACRKRRLKWGAVI